MKKIKIFGSLFILWSHSLSAGTEVERISIIGSAEDLKQQAGSAHRIDEDELDQFSYTDIHRILKQVPGVNIQEEDGLGLRPNIGLRGAHPHRSRKVTILEDGILIGPAPYSAPAAYYFPLMTRASAVEVFKGPSAVRFGPNSIGGAINIITRSFPDDKTYSLTTELGSYGTKKAIARVGLSNNKWSHLVEGSFYAGDGFKKLPFESNLGFKKDDVMLKSQYRINHQHALTLKTVIANETSQETYLGLSDTDFKENAFQRYAASERDQMKWRRDQVMLSYDFEKDQLGARISMYRHWFERNWSKFSGFSDESISARDVLNNPTGANQGFYQILKGQGDSLSFNDKLIIGDNKRHYLSEGIQSGLDWELPGMGDGAILKLGLRFHQDKIQRDHTENTFLMLDGRLIRDDSIPTEETNQKQDSSVSTSAYAQWEQFIGSLKLTLGSRHEMVATESINPLSLAGVIENRDAITTFGLGSFYQWTSSFGWLVGINQGVTLVGPGQSDEVKPEKAMNLEAGFRYQNGGRSWSLVSFYSDYSNIKGTCTFSSGCRGDLLDSEYNGGEALIKGIELLGQEYQGFSQFSLGLAMSYTYTNAYFTEARNSSNPEWGLGPIEAGDPLPYIASHMLNGNLSLLWGKWESHLGIQYKSEMYDQAVAAERITIPSFSVVDLSFTYSLDSLQKINIKVDNVLDEIYLTSVRPFGRRPGKPRSVMISYQWSKF